jgi:hypothetical protein
MKTVLYLHGFASSPDSAKVRTLRALLEPQQIVLDAPDLNVPIFERLDFEAVVQRAIDSLDAGAHQAIAGSSFGGLVALEVLRRGHDLPAVLIAPALGMSDQWLGRLPAGDPIAVPHHGRGVNVPIHRAFFEQMSHIDADRFPPRGRVTIVMGRNDESVPFERVAATWSRWEASGKLAEGSRLIIIEDGDHSLVAAAETIADAISAAVR